MSLSGLLVWVDGQDFGDAGTTISDWPNQSGRAADLLNGGNTPLAVHTNAFGSLSAATFSDSEAYSTATDYNIGNDNFVMEAVVKPGTCATYHSCTFVSLGDGAQANAAVSYGDGMVTGELTLDNDMESEGVTEAVTAGTHIFGFRRTSASAAEVRVDGVADRFTMVGVYTLGGSSFVVGNGNVDQHTLHGDVGEVVLVHNPSDDDVANLETYLKSKYGL